MAKKKSSKKKATQPASCPEKIRIGTLVKASGAAEYIRQILPHGFESFSLTFWKELGNIDIERLAGEVGEVIADRGAVISSLSIFGNPLSDHPGDKPSRAAWKKLVDKAHLFGCDIISGFSGRVVDKPIPDSIKPLKKFYEPLLKRAADRGVRIAFENCRMGGDWQGGAWNIAQGPDAWDRIFDALPHKNLGLQWEPCHQMVNLIDPMPQLRKYMPRIFHVHGKDATIRWDVIREYGIRGSVPWAFHRTPGFGDSNWTDIISELRLGGYEGSIDIEGWHDPVYRDEMEMTGQVHGLNYLKQCRGGSFAPNPSS
jgi:sugar phosphate isomerase/epimerase